MTSCKKNKKKLRILKHARRDHLIASTRDERTRKVREDDRDDTHVTTHPCIFHVHAVVLLNNVSTPVSRFPRW